MSSSEHVVPALQALGPVQLRHVCNPRKLQFLYETEDVDESFAPVGQKRAVEAIKFGLDIGIKGYNIFVLGPPGTGKTSICLRLIQMRAALEDRPGDTCYVHNFEDSNRPMALALTPGTGARLQKAINSTMSGLARSIRQTLTDEQIIRSMSLATAELDARMEGLFDQIEALAVKTDLELEKDDDQFMVVPLRNGQPIEGDYSELSIEEQAEIQERVMQFQLEAAPLITEQRELEQLIDEKLSKLEQRAIAGLVDNTFRALKESFVGEDSTLFRYLKGMQAHLMENHRELSRSTVLSEEKERAPMGSLEMDAYGSVQTHPALPLPYQVNVLVSHKESGSPVYVEKEPSLLHLFGYLEYKEGEEGLVTDHTMIRSGSLHRTNGGYILLQAADVIGNPEVWESLKRALRHRDIRLRDLTVEPEKPRIFGMLRPMEVPLDLKVVLIGSHEEYFYLMSQDEDFERVFKVKAEFEGSIPRNEQHELEYCYFLRRICNEEGLLPADYDAMATMIEESSREVENQKKLSTSLMTHIDLLRESDYWARQRGHLMISSEDVHQALRFRNYRRDSIERNILETIEAGELMIDTSDKVVGQINGLVVYHALDHHFGVPTRITARTWAGNDGVINIDREARLSGALHDKGSMILVGLLGGVWGQEHALTFNASITFEQLYGEIEGDSASCAEFYALLSSLANVPIHQGIAVTGSVNQQGFLQPIGGAQAKIEGMFKICQQRGLDGTQGVIIPVQNVHHLMLNHDVIKAVEDGMFHVWAIHHISEGIELLMKTPAGERDEEGNWSEGSLFERIQDRFEQLYRAEVSRWNRG
jgi:predicted ATP-dependent protease